MDSTRKTARLAGLLYLLSSIPGAFALLYVPSKLIVRGDAPATADRLRANTGLMRLGIGAELAGISLFVLVALVLYRLFKPVDEPSALAMMVLFLVSAPVSFIGILGEVAALNLAGSGGVAPFLSVFSAPQRDALAYLGLRLHSEATMIAQVFWGLWLFPFAVCVIRSGFIPRILGVLLIIAAPGYIAASLADLVFPDIQQAVGRVSSILTLAELPIIFWLLIWGARPQRTAVGASATG